jgi:hypothetical protein
MFDLIMIIITGSWPAGIDTSYPKKAIYPGILAFYKELDLGIKGLVIMCIYIYICICIYNPHAYKDI